ncbi:hypothetical protein PC121_g4723 [Phytophthora cactorum]|nr:hypothetical protein PC121_g4723 [Phytophthora cactorum]
MSKAKALTMQLDAEEEKDEEAGGDSAGVAPRTRGTASIRV